MLIEVVNNNVAIVEQRWLFWRRVRIAHRYGGTWTWEGGKPVGRRTSRLLRAAVNAVSSLSTRLLGA